MARERAADQEAADVTYDTRAYCPCNTESGRKRSTASRVDTPAYHARSAASAA